MVALVVGPEGPTDCTEMLPSTPRLLFQITPAPPPVMVSEPPPVTSLLKIWKVSPATRAEPRLLTVTVPVPAFASAPMTEIKSLVWPRDLLTRTDTPPLMVRLLLRVNVPIEAAEPPPMVPLVTTMTGPAMYPEPASRPPLLVVGPR